MFRFSLKLDAEPACSAIRELSAVLSGLAGQVPQSIRDHLVELLKDPRKFFRLKSCPAVGTVIPVLLEPSDSLLDLLAAARAVKIE